LDIQNTISDIQNKNAVTAAMYNKSSDAIIYKLLVSSAVCVYSVLAPVSW